MSDKGESTIFEKALREAGAGVISLEEACKFRDQIGQRKSNREKNTYIEHNKCEYQGNGFATDGQQARQHPLQ
jgi:hypothetical protein